MVSNGQWEQWSTYPDGYSLNVGRSFLGEAHKRDDELWKATLNARDLGCFPSREAAMERVEYEITMLMRLAIEDLANFRPKRPGR
jgi:hypothetical protein